MRDEGRILWKQERIIMFLAALASRLCVHVNLLVRAKFGGFGKSFAQ